MPDRAILARIDMAPWTDVCRPAVFEPGDLGLRQCCSSFLAQSEQIDFVARSIFQRVEAQEFVMNSHSRRWIYQLFLNSPILRNRSVKKEVTTKQSNLHSQSY